MTDCTALGMPLQTDGDDYDIKQPLAALVVVKALDEDGEIAYYTTRTEGLTAIEAWGMAMFAAKVAGES